MKNIIIVGPSRTGKTTLANKINEELHCFILGLDKVAAVFGRAYPKLDIRLNWNYRKTTDNIAPFLGHFLGVFSSSHHCFEDEQNLRAPIIKGNQFVLEGAYFNFEIISNILKMYGINELRDNFILIGLVQNKKTMDEFINDFRKYDTKDDWTFGFDDEDLMHIAEDCISDSREMTNDFTKYGFAIYDTSKEREQVFKQIIKDIKSKWAQDDITPVNMSCRTT